MANTFKTWKDLPKLTTAGFTVIDCPAEIWTKILAVYELTKQNPHIERFANKEDIIEGGNPEWNSEIYRLDFYPERSEQLHNLLQPMHEEWVGRKLIKQNIYGIRSYLDQTSLIMHRDRVGTHHVSSIIHVDQDIAKPWPLHIEDHEGKEHLVYTEPGQIILYESATCLHGRPTQFEGTYYRNFYVHYRLQDWQFAG
jgi:hypothetical protein